MKRNVTDRLLVIIPVVHGLVVMLAPSLASAQPLQPPGQKPPVPVKKPIAPPVKVNPEAERLIKVATLRTNDGSADKVRRTFKTAKIPVMVMGQLMYGVLVKKKDRDRAIRLLKADSKKQHYWIQFNS